MAGFRIKLFKGIRPRISALKLPVGEAQTAQNTKLGSGDLRAWDEKDAGTAVDSTWYNRTVYLFDNAGTPRWFQWDTLVDVARGPVKDDSLERTYFTGDGVPKMTYTTIADAGGGGPYPEADRDLGIPIPPNALGTPSTSLPEDLQGDKRNFSSITCDAFILDLVSFAVYPGTGSDNQTWRRGTSGYVSDAGRSVLTYDIEAGTSFRVKRVISTTKAVLESADTPGIFARAVTVPWDGNIGASNLASQVRMDEQGSTKEAHFFGWVIPEATVTFGSANHNLSKGDVITISSAGGEDISQMQFVIDSTLDFYEQSWGAESEDPVNWGTPGNTAYQLRNARVAASTTEGDSTFSIEGTFTYDVNRSASEESEVSDRQYVYTYVSALGEEGPPSAVSTTVEVLGGNTVVLTGFENVFTHIDLDNRDITAFRIYRTNSSEAGTEFQFVGEVGTGSASLPTTKFVDTVSDALLGEALDTTTWFPPAAGMQGIIVMPNGMMVGFKGKTLFFSEPFFPHAYPPEYDQAVDYEIVGLAAFGNSVAVMTKGHPYIATGAHPRNVNVHPFKLNQACLNKESIATDGNKVYYASPDGLVEISANGARLATDPYTRKGEWTSYSPATMVGEFHDGKYFGFFDGPANVTQAPAIATLTGTFVSAATDEGDIQSGGKTIIITLTGTGSHTWEDAGGSFNATRQAIIDSFDSDKSEANGWNAERSNISEGNVARTSATIVTITLSALANFEITVAETITCTLPTSVFKATAPADSITAGNTLALGTEDDFSSKLVYVTDTGFYGYSTGDADQWVEAAIDSSGTVVPASVEKGAQHVVYDNKRDRWTIAVRGIQPNVIPVTYTSDNDTGSWIRRESFNNVKEGLTVGPAFIEYYPEYDLFLGSFSNTVSGISAVFSKDGGENWHLSAVDSVGEYDAARGETGFATFDGGFFIGAWKASGDAPKLVVAAAATPEDNWNVETISLSSSPVDLLDTCVAGNGKLLYAWLSSVDNDIEIGYYDPVAQSHSTVGAVSNSGATALFSAFGNGKFMIMQTNSAFTLATADDSEETLGNWSAMSTPLADTLVYNLYYDGGDGVLDGWGWVLCGENTSSNKGVIFTSDDDGDNWTLRHTTAANAKIKSIAFSNYTTDLEKA